MKTISLTDGGMETEFLFHDQMDLPLFAAYPLLKTEKGRMRLRHYYNEYLEIAKKYGSPFDLGCPTWRASSKWGAMLGDSPAELDRINRESVEFMRGLAPAEKVSGCIGPQCDGYSPKEIQSAEDSRSYHSAQIASFAGAGADHVTAMTLTYSDEAIGIVRAATDHEIPAVISFTVETDGRLPSGEPLGEAIAAVDQCGATPHFYIINCAHPTHFVEQLSGEWRSRIGGIRANASRMSHAELDESEVLDDGDPAEFGEDYKRLRELLPNLQLVGGCCGTDKRHIEKVAEALF